MQLLIIYFKVALLSTIFTKMLNLFTLYGIIVLGSQSAGWFPSPEGGGVKNTYEEFNVILGVAMLIVTILIYVNGKNGTKK